MSDKHLTAAAWKAIAKDKACKDAALIKALTAWERAASAAPDERVKALDEVETQAQAMLKAVKADKELADHLADVQAQVKVDRKKLNEAIKSQASADDEDDDESPAALTTKLGSLLKEVRRGVPMNVMLAVGSNDAAVLLSRRAIPVASRKLLQGYLGLSSGLKYPVGQCIWEANAFTFVLLTASQAPAKKVKAALKNQLGILAKVRVRGEALDDVDEDDEDAEQAKPADSKAADTEALLAGLKQELAKAQPAIKAAMATGGQVEAVLARLSKDLAMALQAGDPVAARTCLDKMDSVLDKLKSIGGGAAKAPAALMPLWRDAREGASAQIEALSGTMRNSGHPLLIRVADQGLNGLTQRLQVGMQVALMEYDGAAPATRAAAARKVRAQVDDYRAFLKQDRALPLLERNPLGVSVNIRARLGQALDQIDARLKADGV